MVIINFFDHCWKVFIYVLWYALDDGLKKKKKKKRTDPSGCHEQEEKVR